MTHLITLQHFQAGAHLPCWVPFAVAVWCLCRPFPIVGCCLLVSSPSHAPSYFDLSRCLHPGPRHVIGRGGRWLGPIGKQATKTLEDRDVCFNSSHRQLPSASPGTSPVSPASFWHVFTVSALLFTAPIAPELTAYPPFDRIQPPLSSYAASSLWGETLSSLSKFSMRTMQFQRGCSTA